MDINKIRHGNELRKMVKSGTTVGAHVDWLLKKHEPLPDTYACQRCGRRDGLDAVADNGLWGNLGGRPGGWNLLCLWCMDELAADKGLTGSVTLHFAGKALHGTSQSDADHDHVSRLVNERDDVDREMQARVRLLREQLSQARLELDIARGLPVFDPFAVTGVCEKPPSAWDESFIRAVDPWFVAGCRATRHHHFSLPGDDRRDEMARLLGQSALQTSRR